MSRCLIINADDFNLTPGVSRGILQAHDEGVVTSTTILINLPLEVKTVKSLKRRKKLGLGIHLNVTLAKPLHRPSKIPSLMGQEGRFRRPPDYFQKTPRIQEVVKEYEVQIQLFEKHFSKKPDHLDTHHHLHDHPVFFKALAEVAKRWKVPVRRSRIFQMSEFHRETKNLRTTDYLLGNLETRHIWQKESFLGVVENLQTGTTEIGCHPGFCDAKLRQISSLQEVREKELRLFSDRSLRKKIDSLDIKLVTFNAV